MDFAVRLAVKADMPQVLDLIKELAIFEKEPDAVEITEKQLEQDGFGGQPMFTCLVAETVIGIVGMALFYPRYSTWKGKTIHLEDLIIKQNYRGKGIGNKLFSEVIKYGYKQGVKRIEWNVLDWNEPAITFYENQGATVLRDWDVVQMDEKGIQNFIKKLENENI